MADNDEILKGLEEGEAPQRLIPSTPVTSESDPSNHEKLNQLQTGNEEQTHANKGSKGVKSQTPIFTTGTQQQTPSSSSTTKSRPAALRTWIGIGTAVVVGLVLTFIVGKTLTATDSRPEESQKIDSTESTALDLYAPPSDLESFIQRITASTVIVECAVSEESEYADVGSGFVVDITDLTGNSNFELVIVTNHHVVESCTDGDGFLLAGRGDEFRGVNVLGYDIANDLAIIDLGALSVEPLLISEDISVGQWVMTSGSPVGIESNVTFGQVTNTSTPSDIGGSDMIASDAVIGPGNSGGPLVNSSGQAIAVNSAFFVEVTGISLSVPLTYLCASILSCKS